VAEFSPDRAAFAKVVTALRPYLGEVVFVGGWAHQLHTLHELASPLDFQPLTTADADVAAPADLRIRGPSIRELLQRNGFEEALSGDENPPVSEYRLGGAEGSLYVEFLAPRSGSATRRGGSPDATVSVAGISAQKLKYLEILLLEPWAVQLNESNGYPLGKDGLAVRIPNAAAYLMHKVLVLKERKDAKQPKDVLYIHDTLRIFSAALEQLQVGARLVAQKVHPKWLQTFDERRRVLFARVDDRLRQAARIALESGRPHPPSPEELRLVCQQGLEKVFGQAIAAVLRR
jgi:hypothetical protein